MSYPLEGEQILTGLVGDIEAVIQYPKYYQSGAPVAVVCHPHPLHGGTMTNKVVHYVARSFLDMGLPVLRFNFRGVGKSAGSFDNGRGESEDLALLLNWFHQQHGDAPVWLAGFSFGAYVAARTFRHAAVERLLLVAPAVSKWDFSEIGEMEIPVMVIQGGQDEVVESDAVTRWVNNHAHEALYHWLDDAGHFFHGRLPRLRELIVESWG
jgi:hypothetical protein